VLIVSDIENPLLEKFQGSSTLASVNVALIPVDALIAANEMSDLLINQWLSSSSPDLVAPQPVTELRVVDSEHAISLCCFAVVG